MKVMKGYYRFVRCCSRSRPVQSGERRRPAVLFPRGPKLCEAVDINENNRRISRFFGSSRAQLAQGHQGTFQNKI